MPDTVGFQFCAGNITGTPIINLKDVAFIKSEGLVERKDAGGKDTGDPWIVNLKKLHALAIGARRSIADRGEETGRQA